MCMCIFLTEKGYETVEEEIHRFNLFRETLKKIEVHNKLYHLGHKTYSMGVNNFTDWVREVDLINDVIKARRE